MSETPRMNAAQSSNERYRVGCELESELAAIVPRLNAEWRARLDAMTARADKAEARCDSCPNIIEAGTKLDKAEAKLAVCMRGFGKSKDTIMNELEAIERGGK